MPIAALAESIIAVFSLNANEHFDVIVIEKDFHKASDHADHCGFTE